ncbi:MAG: type II toxin-antitoxin system death-on-curing family toxin [Candidatus Daviesbacteria bacterium]|nr:type II toxin-antitoxin system death-on-curing family toxin [Candidatus Daviesbacteria bacterium]
MPKLLKDSPTPRWLDIEDFQYLCFDLARELLTFAEPIPDYSTRDNGLLESALGAPRQTFDNKLLYPTLVKQSAILFYSLIKNHPFRNGNKRVAVMALLAFLSLNEKWLTMDDYDLYKLAQNVSESKPEKREQIIKDLEKIIEKSLRESS